LSHCALPTPCRGQSSAMLTSIGPALVRLGESLASWDVLVPLRSTDSLSWPVVRTLTSVASCMVFPLTHWCFRVNKCVKKQCGLAVVFQRTMGQDCNYQLDMTKFGRKMGTQKRTLLEGDTPAGSSLCRSGLCYSKFENHLFLGDCRSELLFSGF
jgi:hypothetical protein